MVLTKQCRQCKSEFTTTDDDLNFLDKISPEFAGKKFPIPAPTKCHECREIQRFVCRNDRVLYKRKCDKTGEEIVSVYPPDRTKFKVWKNSEWRKDDWNPLEYERDFDFSRPFFEQYFELMQAVPRQASNTTMNENSDYCNQTWQTKDSYLCFNVGYGERLSYCTEAFYVKDCVDCLDIRNSELLYGCFNCNKCHSSTYLVKCEDCSESHFSYDCKGCSNILLCTNLRNKQFHIENQPYSKEEYLAKIKEYNLENRDSRDKLKEKFRELKLKAIHKANSNIKTENSTGDYLIECNNCKECFNAYKSEGCVRVTNIDAEAKDCRDLDFITEVELCYEGTSVAGYKNLFCLWSAYGNDCFYCNFCEKCSNCFSCVGLTHQQYCILNKQYSRDEYEKLVPKIIEHMIETKEWGEFFPPHMSPFAYNESVASVYYPKSKAQAEKFGAYWEDGDFTPKYEGAAYEPKADIADYVGSSEEREKFLSGVIKCTKTGKPFKIMPQELAFYLKNKIPVPTVHSEERFKEILAQRNPRQLYHRKCMNEGPSSADLSAEASAKVEATDGRCNNEFETTYAPDRPEKIFCEQCYQKSVL
jgi:hypothetical protein